MIDSAQKRGELIKHLEDALGLADEIQDGQTRFLIERALDEAAHVNLGLLRIKIECPNCQGDGAEVLQRPSLK